MSNLESSQSRGASSTKPKSKTSKSSIEIISCYKQNTSLSLAIILITVVSVFVVLVALTMMQLWPKGIEQLQTSSQVQPGDVPGNTIGNSINASLFGWGFNISAEERLLVLVLLGSTLGGATITVYNLAWDMWYASLNMGMLAWYLTRPLISAGLGLSFYLVIVGGFFSPQTSANQANPFTFVGLAVLVGLFTEQAMVKLGKIADSVFAESSTKLTAKSSAKSRTKSSTKPTTKS